MPPVMTQDQRDTLDAFLAHAETRDDIRGVILSGSLVKAWGNEHSDVDLIVVLTDEAFRERQKTNDLAIWHDEFATYEGGGVDAKYVDRSYLEHAAKDANEATRNAFAGARVVWPDNTDLQPLVDEIGTYPEAGVDDRIARFVAQLETARWFITQADKRSNAYLASWTATRGALFACRIILAHNRILYPFHKWVLRALEDAPDKPAGLADAIDRAIRNPCGETVDPMCELVLSFRDWPQPPGNWGATFMRDTEQAWMRHEPAIEDV